MACIIRTYNNNPDSVKAVIRSLKNGIGWVIVVVHGHDETTRGRVRRDIDTDSKIAELGRNRVIVIEMMSGYSWSNALNVALARIQMMNSVANRKREQSVEFVLPLSVETIWERSHLDSMFTEMLTSDRVGCVGTSFDGRDRGTTVDLGISYDKPRNTMMLIRWSAIVTVGHFDAWCDSAGGMEDFHFILRMLIVGNFTWSRLDLKVPLKVGVNHNQAQKEERELAAMIKIVNYMMGFIDGDTELMDELRRGIRLLGAGDLLA
ncbi:MAG TPA: hypothetical protein DIS59_00505 [Candidatus Magasanikbacteria bacterium]|nr:hypothetical protein [Candidatus Magasanikbacteria bacterium]